MFKSRIVCLVFPLKIIMVGSIRPSAVTDKTTVRCVFLLPEEQTTHTLSSFFAIHFDGNVSNAGVLSMLPTRESGYFPALMKRVASSQDLLRTPATCFDSFWLMEIRVRRASLCRLKNFLTQHLLALKDELVVSKALLSRLKTKIYFSSSTSSSMG